MTDRIEIAYGEFHDFPRMMQFEFEGVWFLMRSYFDEEDDDYASEYDVYRLPFQSKEEIEANPEYFTKLNDADHLGQIPITEVGLDESRRKSIDATLFKEWQLRCKAPLG